MTVFASVVSFASGGALIWFTKDWIVSKVVGARALVTMLETKAAKIRAAL